VIGLKLGDASLRSSGGRISGFESTPRAGDRSFASFPGPPNRVRVVAKRGSLPTSSSSFATRSADAAYSKGRPVRNPYASTSPLPPPSPLCAWERSRSRRSSLAATPPPPPRISAIPCPGPIPLFLSAAAARGAASAARRASLRGDNDADILAAAIAAAAAAAAHEASESAASSSGTVATPDLEGLSDSGGRHLQVRPVAASAQRPRRDSDAALRAGWQVTRRSGSCSPAGGDVSESTRPLREPGSSLGHPANEENMDGGGGGSGGGGSEDGGGGEGTRAGGTDSESDCNDGSGERRPRPRTSGCEGMLEHISQTQRLLQARSRARARNASTHAHTASGTRAPRRARTHTVTHTTLKYTSRRPGRPARA
jgi:hypothetical protein